MRKMKDSGVEWIGEIPEDWEVKKNKYILSNMYSGGTPTANKPELYSDEGTPFVSIGDMSETDYVCDTKKKLSDLGVKEKNLKILPAGTIIYSIYATIGAVSELKIQATISQALLALSINNQVIKSWYKYNLNAMRDYICFSANGNTQFNLNAEKVWNFSFVIPPIDTQRRIADFLDDKCGKIDRYIEKQQRIIDKLKEYKQAVITEAVTKGLDPDAPMKDSGIEWIGMIPEHWEVKKFGYIATVKANLVHPNAYGDYPQVSSENIEKSTGRLLKCKTVNEVGVISDNHLFFKGQILYSKIRPALNKACIAPFDGLCSADIYPIETMENTEFVLFSILSESFLEQVRTLTETRVKMPKINQNELSGILSCVPPLEEQNNIVAYINRKMKSIEHVLVKKERILEKLIEYKRSLIYEAVTGKLEV